MSDQVRYLDPNHPWWFIVALAQKMGNQVSIRLKVDGQEYVFAQGGTGQLDIGLKLPPPAKGTHSNECTTYQSCYWMAAALGQTIHEHDDEWARADEWSRS